MTDRINKEKNNNHSKNDLKKNLPSKICIVCNKPFNWRKKWQRDWKNVLYCSKKCSKNALNKQTNK